jgi:DNA (cytosine-5)-methyltransferase 1
MSDIFSTLNVTPGPGWPDRFGAALREAISPPPIRTLSLFSGGGGLDIGFHDAGFGVGTMVEIDKRFAPTLEANSEFFGNPTVLNMDIRDFSPDQNEKIDFIIGGPPCNSFSACGKRDGGVRGTSDPRGMLFQEYVRILETLRPSGFLFENVPGLLGSKGGGDWKMIKAAFAEAGYSLFFRILDAADYGVPQHRERVFIVGLSHGEFLFPRPTHGPDSPGKVPHFTAGEAILDVELSLEDRDDLVKGIYGHLLPDIPPGLNYAFYTAKMGHPNPVFEWRTKFSYLLYKADPEMPVKTITAQAGPYCGPFHWENRYFSLAEVKRLQTFPDFYVMMGAKRVVRHQLGNSVPPQMARMLALSIMQQVFGADLPFDLPLLPAGEELSFKARKRGRTAEYQKKATEAINFSSM